MDILSYALTFPQIDPVLVQIGPLAIRWYSLSYIGGVLLGWWYLTYLNKLHPAGILDSKAIEDIPIWAIVGIVLGGRLGYVLFYKPDYYFANPMEAFYLWQGGMSFHGGLIGVITALILFSRKIKRRFFEVIDMVACATPIGLFLGRLANFINGELYGRITDAEIGMVFPNGGPFPRHPSQLYEAALEGLALFIVLFVLVRFTRAKEKVGLLSGVFLLGYALARTIVENFREPDAFLGELWGAITMGQLLSAPMILYGIYLIITALKRPVAVRDAA